MGHPNKKTTRMLESLAGRCVKWAGSQWALEVVLSLIAIWLFVGPFVKFSTDWQMVLDTTSAVITLVMVFLLVRTQAKDTLVIQTKLNEIIAVLQGANNQLISIENLSEAAILELSKRYETIATKLLKEDAPSTESIVSHEIAAEKEKRRT